MIGVFDSGYGGLSILKEFKKQLPNYDYLYLGDNARAPYGDRSHETIKKFTKQGVNYLFKQGCSLVIIACNTASSQVLRELQQELLIEKGEKNKKILGVIRPLAEETIKLTKNKNIGVVGTTSTINAKSYPTEINKLNKEIKVVGRACPLLVPLIEQGWHKKPEAKMILKKYIRPLKDYNIDTLILGCTHYPFMIKEFKKYMGKKVTVVNPGEIVAKKLKEYLKNHPEIDKKLTKTGKTKFTTTDSIEKFKTIGSNFLETKITNIQQVNLE